jgi:hypothetical protein
MTSPRLPGDVNRAFDQRVTPSNGDCFRFELETRILIDEHDSDFESACLVVCWHYRMHFNETARYFDARDGWRFAH